MEKDNTSNPLENAVRLTRKLPPGKAKLGLLCKCAVRLIECAEPEEGRKLFKEAQSMLDDIPVDHGRKYLLHELALASLPLSLSNEGKSLTEQLEAIFDEEVPGLFSQATAGLVVQSWAALGCFDKIENFLNKVPPKVQVNLLEIAILQAASNGAWLQVPQLLANSAIGANFLTEISADLLLRLSRSDLITNESAAIMRAILELSETDASR